MELFEYQNIYRHEDQHFFYVGIHELVLMLARHFELSIKPLRILDAGCGTGLLAKKLKQLGEVWGIDIHPAALSFTRRRGVKVKKASVTKLPFENGSFDLVICIDVLYHQKVKSDALALKEIFRVLRSGGRLILRVPAHRWLRLSHDRYVHTRQRYEKDELNKKLVKAGFFVEKMSFTGMSLYPALIFHHFWEKIFSPGQDALSIRPIPECLNQLLILFLRFEVFLTRWVNLPQGIGLIAVARKSARGKFSDKDFNNY